MPGKRQQLKEQPLLTYEYYGSAAPLYLLYVYLKNAKETLTLDDNRLLNGLVDQLKRDIKAALLRQGGNLSEKKSDDRALVNSIAAGLKDAIAHAKGQPLPGTLETVMPDVKIIREKLGMSQTEFAQAYRIPVGTLKGWEQGRRNVDAPAAALLRAIEKFPEQVRVAQADKPQLFVK